MRKHRNLLAFVLAVLMVFGAIPFSAYAAVTTSDFSDFPTGWSNAAMTDAVENGLITGYEDNTVRPRDLLTRAQMAAIINRAFGAEQKADIAGAFTDVSAGDWFYDDIAKAVQMRTFNGCTNCLMRPNDPITRQDAILVIARALVIDVEDTSVLNAFGDRADVANYAEGALAAFIQRGYLNGYEDKTLRPLNNITREEFAQIMYNIFASYERRDGYVSLGDCEGEVILTGDNVHLFGTNVHGDLIIGDGVGATDVILENVTVEGRIIFRGGEGLVTLKNVTKGGLIVVNDYNGTVNFNHYSTEAIFTNAVYNTPATFLDRSVAGNSASGTGLGTHDTLITGKNDAGTGKSDDSSDLPSVVNPGSRPSTTTYYSVVIDPDNGTSIYRYNIRKNSNLASLGLDLPADPSKDGYRFDGWYYTVNGVETPFDESTKITANTNVYAKWIEQVDVSFLEEKGGEIIKTETLDIDTPLDETKFPSAPEKTGHTFAGWVYDDGGVEKSFDKSTAVKGDISVYPTWTVNSYSVKFTVDGEDYAEIEIEYGTPIGSKLPAAPEKDGYIFDGWYIKGTDTEVTPETVVTEDMEIEARFTEKAPDTFVVTFNVDGEKYAEKEVEDGGKVDALPTDPVKDGYSFDGWYIADTDTEFTVDTVVTGDISVEARFTINTYTVTYVNEGKTYHSEEVEHGKTVTAIPAEPSHADIVVFLGWFHNVDGTETEFTADTVITSDVTVNAKWQGVKYTVIYTVDGQEYDTATDIASGATVGELPTAPEKDGYTFDGWFYDVAGEETEFTADTAVYANITVEAKFTKLYSVYFCEYGDETYIRYTVENIAGGTAVSADEIAAATGKLDEPYLTGYEASTENISATYPGDVTHLIAGEWYYLDENEYKVFDDSVVVNSDMYVFYYFKHAKIHVNLESFFGTIGNVALEVPYEEDTLGVVTVLDLLHDSKNAQAVKTAAKLGLDKLLGKSVKVEGLEYMPLDENGEIMNPTYDYRLIDLLGEKTIRDYTGDAVTDMIEGDEKILTTAVEEIVEGLDTPEEEEILDITDDYVMSHNDVKDQFQNYVTACVVKDNPNMGFADVPTEVARIMASETERKEIIVRASNDEAAAAELVEAIVDMVKEHLANDYDHSFINHVVVIAQEYYRDEIEEFIYSLKNSDTYLINYEAATDTDRRFIVNAVSKKLEATTYEDIKEKLPDVIFKVIDENILRDIYNKTMDDYKADVNAVKDIVFAEDYDGTSYYVSSFATIEVDLIDQFLIPYYNKGMAKLDPKIKGFKYYDANPYIKEIEALMHYDQLVTATGKESPYSGYKIKSVDEYYALLYKLAVLGYDAGQWFIDNVPEEELDATIELAANRIGGYYDKLEAKISILSTGKVVEVKTKAQDFFNKILDKNNESMWNSATTEFAVDKLETVYNKAQSVVLDKTGFDISEEVKITIASDCKSVTVSQGTRTVTKSINDIAKDIEYAGHKVSVNGSVITIDDGKSIDVADYAKKLADKLGYEFSVSLAVDEAELAKPEKLVAYKLTVNSDYITVQVLLK